MIYVYLVDGTKKVAVVAENSTIANDGLTQKYPNRSKRFLGVIDEIFQVNGTAVIDMPITEIATPENTTDEGTQNYE